MAKKIDVKVSINCTKCKIRTLRAVTKLAGIDQLTVDGEKGLLTVVGTVDPVVVIKRLRRLGKVAELISVGPPKKPDPPKSPPKPLPASCNDCRCIAVTYEYESFCTIL